MTAISIIAGILIFGFLIAIHEFGHFFTAKLCGVRVNEYAIGMGPALLQKQKGETIYSWRLFPVGGYCAMEGEEEDSADPRALNQQGFWAKLLIFSAGALMNFLAGLLIVAILYSGAKAFYEPTIVGFAEGCPLQSESGLQEGDTIYAINGERVYVYSDLSLLMGLNKTDTYDLTVLRDGGKVYLQEFTMVRAEYPDQNGSTYTGYGLFFGVQEASFGEKIRYTWNNTVDFARMVRLSLRMIVNGEAGLKDMSGPVGIVSTMTEVGQQSDSIRTALWSIGYLGALIAVNLAVMNLLPLPALDGGKILFLVVNAISMLLFRRSIPSKYENYIHYAGLIILLGFMILVTFSDIWKLFT